MKSKTSFFNRAIVKEDLKRFWGIGVLYFLALFFIGPLYIFLTYNEHLKYSNVTYSNYIIKRFLDIYQNGFELIYIVVIPILLGTLIFRYLQLKNSTGMIHSFPFTRNILLNSHILSGLIILFIPVLINFIFMIFIYTNMYTGTTIAIGHVYKWFFITLLLDYTVFLMTVFAGMISGVSFVQAVLSLIFLFLPFGLTGLVMICLDRILFGFVADNTIIEKFAMNVIPITSGISGWEMSPGLVIWYLALLVILYFLSKYLYLKRDLENASDTIVFEILKPLFKYGVTFCAMVIGGLYFAEVVRGSTIWLYFGFFIGALLGYIIGEMIIQKSIWVFSRLKGIIPFILAAGILLTAVELDLTGYEKRLPDLNEVESVYFGYYVNRETMDQDYKLLHNRDNFIPVRNIHEMIINSKEEIKERSSERTKQIAIAYKFKDGNILMREYIIPYRLIDNNPYIKEIYESEEYKKISNEIFRVDLNKISSISIDAAYVDRRITITDKNEINEFIAVIKEDILNETYEEMISNKPTWARIRIEYPDEEKEKDEPIHKIFNLQWKKSYEGLEKWFKEKGYYQDVRILSEDVEYITIHEIKDLEDFDRIRKETVQFNRISQEPAEGKMLVVKDKEKIEQILRTYNNESLENKKYIVIFHLKDAMKVYGCYSQENALSFIRDYFKN